VRVPGQLLVAQRSPPIYSVTGEHAETKVPWPTVSSSFFASWPASFTWLPRSVALAFTPLSITAMLTSSPVRPCAHAAVAPLVRGKSVTSAPGRARFKVPRSSSRVLPGD
jgi:hypothetical protein